jgi:hypothetical protein
LTATLPDVAILTTPGNTCSSIGANEAGVPLLDDVGQVPESAEPVPKSKFRKSRMMGRALSGFMILKVLNEWFKISYVSSLIVNC